MSGKGTLGEKAAAVVSGCPCDSCPAANQCVQECATFAEYVRLHSPKRREDNLVDLKVSVAKIPGAKKIVQRSQEFYTGYKRDSSNGSQQGFSNPLDYGDSDFI